MTDLRMGAREWLLLIGLSLIWGGSFFFNEVLLQTLRPLTIVLGRVSLAALALFVIVRVRRLSLPRDRETWLAFGLLGLLNNVLPFSLIVWGQSQITGGLASILNATTPLFTVLLAHLLTRGDGARSERLTVNKLAGVCLGLLGVAVLIGFDALQSVGVQVWAQVAVLGASISYATAVIYGRRFRGTPPVITALGTLTSASIVMLPAALIVERPWTATPTASTWLALLSLALLSTTVAYLIYYYLIATSGATNASLVTLLIPLSAILLGALFLGERLHATDLAGMALILSGLLFVDGRLVRRLRGGASPAPVRPVR